MVTYHASNGGNFLPGDLIGSGTASGPTDESRACMNELSAFGTSDIQLPNGETRRYLEDGDEVIFRAHARARGPCHDRLRRMPRPGRAGGALADRGVICRDPARVAASSGLTLRPFGAHQPAHAARFSMVVATYRGMMRHRGGRRTARYLHIL